MEMTSAIVIWLTICVQGIFGVTITILLSSHSCYMGNSKINTEKYLIKKKMKPQEKK